MSLAASVLFDHLPPPIVQAVLSRGFTALTPVQERVLDVALEGRDLQIASQTGSGKTVAAGFLLSPALAQLAASRRPPKKSKGPAQPFALLIAPTRELAAQVARELAWLYANLQVGVSVVAGGASFRDELRALSEHPLVVVGTPGRLKDHLERGSIEAGFVGRVVLDEADRMLELGFRDELEAIVNMLPAERRTHLMSATFPDEVLRLADRYQRDPVMVEGGNTGEAHADIKYTAHLVHANEREAALVNLLLMAPGERTLMFVRTRADAAELSDRLTQAGFDARPLSGELEQRERNKTLEAFRKGTVKTLVATDVAARGLDIPDVSRVIHVDSPTDAEGLTHRSGRTGRAGNKGESIIFVSPGSRQRVMEIFRRARIDASWEQIPTKNEVYAAADERLLAELVADATEGPDRRLDALSERLLGALDPRTLVRLLLARAQEAGPCAPRNVTPLALYKAGETRSALKRQGARKKKTPRYLRRQHGKTAH